MTADLPCAASDAYNNYSKTKQAVVPLLKIEKIISGGQRGADQAGLFAAKCLGIQTGGTAPKGFKVSNFYNKVEYDTWLELYFGLKQHASSSYPPRTFQNVKNSTGTLIIGNTESFGTALTIRNCNELKKHFIVNPTEVSFIDWLILNKIKVLNVAGNRHNSKNPEIFQLVFNFLVNSLGNYVK